MSQNANAAAPWGVLIFIFEDQIHFFLWRKWWPYLTAHLSPVWKSWTGHNSSCLSRLCLLQTECEGKNCCACLQSGRTAASNLIWAAVSTNTHGNAVLEEYLIVFVYQQCWYQAALPGNKKKKKKRWNLIFNNTTTLIGTVLHEIPFQGIRRQMA